MNKFVNEIENMAKIYYLTENEEIKKYILQKGYETILENAEKIEMIYNKFKLIGSWYKIYERNLMIKLKDELMIKTYYSKKDKGKRATLKDGNNRKIKIEKYVLDYLTEVINKYWEIFESSVKNGNK